MAPFRPRIGKQHVKRGDRPRREQIRDRVRDIDQQHACVLKVALRDFTACRTNAPDETFDPEKIVSGGLLCESSEVRAVAAANVDLERRLSREQFAQVKRREVVARNELDRCGSR